MRQILFMAMIANAIVCAVPSAAAGAEVRIVNETGYGIAFIGVNSPGDEDWTHNRVMSVIRNGTSTQISLKAPGTCRRNIRIAWTNDRAPAILSDVDLCSIRVLTLHYDEGTRTLSYEKR